MSRMSGKVLVVTGSTQGVGEGVAMRAAREGAAGIVICGRQADKGAAVSARLMELGCESEFVQADLSSEDSCREIMRRCDARFGRVDSLVNCAADTSRGTLDETTVPFWDRLFAINVRAPFILMQEAARIMRRESIAGTMANVISVNAYCGAENLCAYSATKGALATLTKNVANGLRPDRIRVNGILLGWTDTPAEHVVMASEGRPDDWLAQAEAASPFGRLIKPDDVARLCMFLLSDDSGILTGSNIDYCQRVMGLFPPERAPKAAKP